MSADLFSIDNISWQPGEPIYDQSEPDRVYQQEPMIEIRGDNSWGSSARWSPQDGWHDWGVL